MGKYPIYLQDEEMACGAYCILMILKYYGYQEEIKEIKQKTRLNQNGISMKGMIECFKAYQIEAKAYEATLEDIQDNVKFPCILYMIYEGIGHFVVLYEIKDDEYIIGDPAKGLVSIFKEDMGDIYTNRMISITHVGRVPEMSYQPFFQYLKHMFQDYRKYMVRLIYKGLWISLLGYLSSYFYQILLDDISLKTPFFYMVTLSLTYAVIELVKTRMDETKNQTLIHLTKAIDEEHVFQTSMNLLSLPYSFFYQDKGQIQSQITSFYELTQMTLECFERSFLDFFSCIVFMIGMIILQPIMALVVFVMLIIIGFISYRFVLSLENLQKEHLEAHFRYQHHLLELIDNHFLIRLFSLQQKTRERSYHLFLDEALSKEKQSSELNHFHHLLQYMIYICYCVIMILGFYFFQNKVLSLGQVLMFYMLMSYCIDPLLQMITLIAQYKQVNIIYEKYKAFLIDEEEEKITFDQKITTIRFDDVGYAYGYQMPILEHIDFTITRHLLVQGVTGSGKSTLLKLLLGCDLHYQGDIYINDYELRTLNLKSLYQHIGYMNQTPSFLHLTLYENFLCDDEDKIKSFLKAFQQEELISLFHIVLDEEGNPLSLGQRQIVSLIRLLCHDYDIYIFDEAFSHMDQKLSSRVLRYLSLHGDDKIYIMVNHQTKIVKKGWDCVIIDDRKLISKG